MKVMYDSYVVIDNTAVYGRQTTELLNQGLKYKQNKVFQYSAWSIMYIPYYISTESDTFRGKCIDYCIVIIFIFYTRHI